MEEELLGLGAGSIARVATMLIVLKDGVFDRIMRGVV